MTGALLAGCGGSGGDGLRIGAIPFEDPQKEQAQFQAFGDYVGQKLDGKPAVVTVALNYVGVVTALENKQIDAAYLNPLSYVIAADRAKKAGSPLLLLGMPYVIPSGQTRGSLTYQGIIFTRKDSGINSLADLKGKTFAFSDVTSTSGHLYPAALMLKAGVNPKPQSDGGDLKQVFYASDAGVVPAVLSGKADAGAIFDEGITLSLKNPADRDKLQILARTEPIPNGMLVARGDMPKQEADKIQEIILGMNSNPEGQAALAKQRVEKWVAPQDNLFDTVRKMSSILDIHLEPAKKT